MGAHLREDAAGRAAGARLPIRVVELRHCRDDAVAIAAVASIATVGLHGMSNEQRKCGLACVGRAPLRWGIRLRCSERLTAPASPRASSTAAEAARNRPTAIRRGRRGGGADWPVGSSKQQRTCDPPQSQGYTTLAEAALAILHSTPEHNAECPMCQSAHVLHSSLSQRTAAWRRLTRPQAPAPHIMTP